MTVHPLLGRWKSMIQRCTNPRNPAYHRYGGRGIGVCGRWLASFDDFVADVGVPADLSLTLDRVDNDRGYEPGNVRWASRAEQSANRSDTRRILYKGRLLPVTHVAREAGVDDSSLYHRIFRLGWPVQKAIDTPPDARFRPRRVHKTYTAPRQETGAVYATGDNS